MIKIFIAENVPSLNKGEMTILEGMLESFKSLGEIEVTMLSPLPEIDQPRYGTKVKVVDAKKSLQVSGDLRGCGKLFTLLLAVFQHLLFLILYKSFSSKSLKLMKSEIWKEYVKSDIIVVGHDGTFGLASILTAFFCRLLGKDVVIYGATISPIKRRPKKIFESMLKWGLTTFNLITLRDEISGEYLRRINVKKDRVFVTADPAFLLCSASAERVEEIVIREGINRTSGLLIGLTVTRETASTVVSDITSSEGSYHRHVRMLAEVIDKLTDLLNGTVIFVPHCIGFGEKLDDRIVAEDIFQICQNKDSVKVIINEYGASELKGLIGQFDLFIGERLHSAINAMSMCVPSIALAYSTDQRLGIIKMFGQEDAICHVENLDADALVSKISNVWAKRDKIREDLKSQTETIRERAMLNGKLLKELLDSRK